MKKQKLEMQKIVIAGENIGKSCERPTWPVKQVETERKKKTFQSIGTYFLRLHGFLHTLFRWNFCVNNKFTAYSVPLKQLFFPVF